MKVHLLLITQELPVQFNSPEVPDTVEVCCSVLSGLIFAYTIPAKQTPISEKKIILQSFI